MLDRKCTAVFFWGGEVESGKCIPKLSESSVFMTSIDTTVHRRRLFSFRDTDILLTFL